MKIRAQKRLDLDKIMETDPAAFSRRIVKRTYSGYKALCAYRYAHRLWQHGLRGVALYISYRAKVRTGVDIHPAAEIGVRVCIDHGVGVVIGETTEIGNDVVLYQGVTLGGTGKDIGKRHPTIEDGVMVSAGAKVLGPVRIGEGSKIGAGSVVLKDVPPHSTVVGVPGRIVRQNGERVKEG
ncbi:MAG: serine O-acetyltransferase [Clostridia bacterium]|nr:serine O-acetyltransferase [Clostridia bacterium]